MENDSTVFIIDDDPAVRQSLAVLMRAMRMKAEAYESAQQFLDAFDPSRPGCLLLDVRMPGISGLESARATQPRGNCPAGDRHVGLRRRADGGPGDEGRRVELPGKALPRPATLGGDPGSPRVGRAHRQQMALRSTVLHCLQRLTPGEHDVLRLLIDGRSNRSIAAELKLSVRTIEVRRAKLMKKMKAESLAELIRLTLAANPDFGKPRTPADNLDEVG